jgi:hypothetical protein
MKSDRTIENYLATIARKCILGSFRQIVFIKWIVWFFFTNYRAAPIHKFGMVVFEKKKLVAGIVEKMEYVIFFEQQ